MEEKFSIECGKGWEKLYKPIIEYIEKYNETHDEKIEIRQIKEKFGGLRFYARPYTDELRKMIGEAEAESYTVCEECGKKCKQINKGGWIYTLCEECYNSMEERATKRVAEFWNKIKEMKEKKQREEGTDTPQEGGETEYKAHGQES